MPMVYEIHRLEGQVMYHYVFDTKEEAGVYIRENKYELSCSNWSNISYGYWSNESLRSIHVMDMRKPKKETKSMEPVTETVTKLKVGDHTVTTSEFSVIKYWTGATPRVLSLKETGFLTKKEVKELSEFLAKLSDMMED